MYLRARHYAPGMGRFLTKDPSGSEANRYNYTSSNPINRIDPTGLLSISDLSGPALFAMCFDMHSITRGANLGVVTAQLAVDVCRLAYSKDIWNPNASPPMGFNFIGSRPTTGHDLFGWYLFEHGGSKLTFQGDQPLTKELARSKIIDKYIRYKYYKPGLDIPATLLEFDLLQQAECINLHLMVTSKSMPITCVLGSFYYQAYKIDSDTLGIRIDNRTDLESGTHIVGRHRSGLYSGSVEELIANGEVSPYEPLASVIWRKDVISILKPLDISDTESWTGYFPNIGTHQLGGGNFEQTYVWREKLNPCPTAWDMILYQGGYRGITIEIEPWLDYKSYTSSIIW